MLWYKMLHYIVSVDIDTLNHTSSLIVHVFCMPTISRYTKEWPGWSLFYYYWFMITQLHDVVSINCNINSEELTCKNNMIGQYFIVRCSLPINCGSSGLPCYI